MTQDEDDERDPALDYAKPVRESKVGDAVLAVLLLPLVLLMGGVLVASVVVMRKEHALGSNESFGFALALVFFALLARAFYVFAARLFDKIVEPLVPWWLAVPVTVVFAGGMLAAALHGQRLELGPAAGTLFMLVAAPVMLYRQQRGAKR